MACAGHKMACAGVCKRRQAIDRPDYFADFPSSMLFDLHLCIVIAKQSVALEFDTSCIHHYGRSPSLAGWTLHGICRTLQGASISVFKRFFQYIAIVFNCFLIVFAVPPLVTNLCSLNPPLATNSCYIKTPLVTNFLLDLGCRFSHSRPARFGMQVLS